MEIGSLLGWREAATGLGAPSPGAVDNVIAAATVAFSADVGIREEITKGCAGLEADAAGIRVDVCASGVPWGATSKAEAGDTKTAAAAQDASVTICTATLTVGLPS